MLPNISVIIPCHNEKGSLQQKVTHTLQALPDEKDEILVIDDGSDDDSFDFLQMHFASETRVHLFRQKRQGKNAALNLGIQNAQHDWIVITDANARLELGSIHALLRPCSNPKVGAVRGRYLPESDNGKYTKILTAFRRAEDLQFAREGASGLLTISGGWLQAIRRQLINPTASRTMAEDWDLTLDVLAQGYTVAYADLAIARKRTPAFAYEIFLQNIRYVYGTLQTSVKYCRLFLPQKKSLVWLSLLSGKWSHALLPLWLALVSLSGLHLGAIAIGFSPVLANWIFIGTLFASSLLLILSSVHLEPPRIPLLTIVLYVSAVFLAGWIAYILFILRLGHNWSGWKPVRSARNLLL